MNIFLTAKVIKFGETTKEKRNYFSKVSISLYNFIEVDWKLLKACIVSKLFVPLHCEFTKLMFNAEVDSKEPLNLKGFAKHMTSHGKIADYQMCVLVLGQVVECMSELLSQGQPVKLDGLGTFSPSVDGQKKGKNDMETAVAVGPDAMINGIKINFTPENTKGEKLTSRAFKDQCIFEYGYVVQSEIRTVNGKQKRVQKKTPISYLMAPAPDNQGNG